MKQDNNILIKDCEFVFKEEENFNQIIKAFWSNKIFLENLKIYGDFTQNNVDLLLFQIQNFIKIINLKIFNLNKKENYISGSLFRIIYMNFENFIFFTKNQTIRVGNLFCFLENHKANSVLIKNAFFSGEFILSRNFLKLQKSSIILKNVHIKIFKGLFLNFLEGRLIFDTVFFQEGENMFANLTKIACLIFNLKILSKTKIKENFMKFNQSKVFVSNLVVIGIHIKKGFLLNFIDSSAFIKHFFVLNIRGYDEKSSLLRISGMSSRIFFKHCNFNMNLGSTISPLFQMDSYEFSSLYIVRCKFSLNSAPNGNIIHLSYSKAYKVFFYKNTFYSNTFKKNGIPMISKGGLFFSYISEGVLKNIENRFRKNKADFGEFIYIEETSHWNFVDEETFKVIDTKNLKEKEFSLAFFDSYSEDLKTVKLENVFFDKKYETCLLTIKLIASGYGDILDSYLNFAETLSFASTFEADRQLFQSNFLNVGGYYCLKGEFHKITSFFSSPQDFKIILKKSKISQAIYFKISFLEKCDLPKFLDHSGVCSSCPIQTYPSVLVKTFFSKDYAKKCLPCDSTNNIGLHCFGDDFYTPRRNYWQPKYGNFIYFRCPHEGNCRGDVGANKESGEVIHDEKYSMKFCEKNYKGLLCLSCAEGYGRWLEHKCESCFSTKNIAFLVFQITIKLLVCVYILSLSLKINIISSLNMVHTQYLKKLKVYYITYMTVNMHVQMADSILSLDYEAFPCFNFLLDVAMMFSTQLKFFIPYQCWSFLENSIFFAKLTIYAMFYFILIIIFLITIFKLSIFSKYVRSKVDKRKYISSAIFISIFSLYFLFSSTLIELAIKAFICVEMKTGENTKIINLFLLDTNIDCATKEFSKIYTTGISIFSLLMAAPFSILIIHLISKNSYLVTYILCYYKPKYFLTGIHSNFPQLITIGLINYIKYVKVINGDVVLLLSLLGLWILLCIFKKAVISIYSLPEIKLKHCEVVLWTYLIALLFMISLKITFADYNNIFILDLLNLIILVRIFFSSETLIQHLKQILKEFLLVLWEKEGKKSKLILTKNKYSNSFNLNHSRFRFLHKFIPKNYLQKLVKNNKPKNKKGSPILAFLLYFFRFKGKLNSENKELALLFKFLQKRSKKKINLNKEQKTYIQYLFDGEAKFRIKLNKRNIWDNSYLSFSFKSQSQIEIYNISILIVNGMIKYFN